MTDGLLLVHAFPLDARMWEPQLSAFSDALPLSAPHLPGFGGSEPAVEVMTMRAAAERCVKELDRAGIDRAVVCGLSMGGYVGFELWRRSRERVLGLALANTRAIPDTAEGSAPSCRRISSHPARSAQTAICSPAPARKVSAAASMTRRPWAA